MNYKKGDIVQFTISDLAFGGVGVGKIGNFAVFVSGAAPGDKICGRLTKIKKQYAEAKLEKIIEAAKTRIKPRCKHFGVCGGCSLQFLNYEDQLKWKEKMAADALRQIGGFRDARVEPIIGCEDPWFYRNKMEYNLGNRQQDTGNSGLILGFHPAKKYYEIFDLEECFLQSPQSVEIALAVKEWARTSEGNFKNLVIREGKHTGECMVNLVLEEIEKQGTEFREEEFRKWIIQKFPNITSLYYTIVTVQKGHRTVIKEFHLAGKKTLTEILRVDSRLRGNDALKFEILPQAFFQTNTKQAETLYGKILEFAAPRGDDTALDLFCGTGTIGMFFAKSGATAIGVDNNESAIANARENARLNSLSNIEFQCADTDKFLSQLFDKRPSLRLGLLITDPPRAGIAAKSLQKIFELKIPKWIYVSCNPATLARDLKIAAENGYQIEKIQPIDMFPQTYHIETICLLTNG